MNTLSAQEHLRAVADGVLLVVDSCRRRRVVILSDRLLYLQLLSIQDDLQSP
jgi:hypothetical protein